MTHPGPDDLAAYAIGGLEPAEEERVFAHVETCDRCRSEPARLAPAVAVLAESVEQREPPPGLRACLLDEVAADAPRHGGGAIAPPPRAAGSPSADVLLRPAAGLAAAAVAIAGVGGYLIAKDEDAGPAEETYAVSCPCLRPAGPSSSRAARRPCTSMGCRRWRRGRLPGLGRGRRPGRALRHLRAARGRHGDGGGTRGRRGRRRGHGHRRAAGAGARRRCQPCWTCGSTRAAAPRPARSAERHGYVGLPAMATCYRHPSRETGVSCSSCGRPICPECMTSTPVGMRCPECAGRTRGRAPQPPSRPLLASPSPPTR